MGMLLALLQTRRVLQNMPGVVCLLSLLGKIRSCLALEIGKMRRGGFCSGEDRVPMTSSTVGTPAVGNVVPSVGLSSRQDRPVLSRQRQGGERPGMSRASLKVECQ
mmetsp:Transcript_11781/g.27303  ORF Transcript_11781/g.27303 Transcript_11781/m.27303 type:complete len:106 (-) Transcript_11781:755-1072(-)